MKTIIVATDYSPTAENALAYAAQLARLTSSKMVIFNAYHLPIPSAEGVMPMLDLQEFIAENKARLTKIAEETAKNYEVKVEAQSGTSLLQDELDALCHQYPEPLVVVGMRGNSLERKIFGSITTSVVRRGKYPVLVVPAEAHFQDIAKILFAYDYHTLKDTNLLSPLKKLAQHFRAQIQVLHLMQTPALTFMEEDIPFTIKKGPSLEKIFRGIKHNYKELETEDIVGGIEKGIEEYGADLLVMVPHKPGFWDNILNRSKTRKMALKTHIPLLALPNTDL